MRLMHMADAHFGRRFSSSRFGPEAAAARRRALEEAFRLLVDYANENAVDAILCAGDLIESAEIRPADLRTLRDILSGLKAAKMYAVSGNHDPLDALSPYGRLNCDKLRLLPAGYSRTMLNEDTALHAFSFSEAPRGCAARPRRKAQHPASALRRHQPGERLPPCANGFSTPV